MTTEQTTEQLQAELEAAKAELAKAIEAADADVKTATIRRDRAIRALLDTGLSLRHVAPLAGLSVTHTHRIQRQEDEQSAYTYHPGKRRKP